jgi:hypothetical protein
VKPLKKRNEITNENLKKKNQKKKRSGNDVRRIVCVTSWGTKSVKGAPWIMEYLMKPTILKGFIGGEIPLFSFHLSSSNLFLLSADMEKMEDILMATNYDYTIVRPPELLNSTCSQFLFILLFG